MYLSNGGCGTGHEVSASQCETVSTWGSSWGGSTNAEGSTCGCYLALNGVRYFNERTENCNQFERGEWMICIQGEGACNDYQVHDHTMSFLLTFKI